MGAGGEEGKRGSDMWVMGGYWTRRAGDGGGGWVVVAQAKKLGVIETPHNPPLPTPTPTLNPLFFCVRERPGRSRCVINWSIL